MTGLLDSAGPSLVQDAKSAVKCQTRPWLFDLRKMVIAWLRERPSDSDTFLDQFAYQNLSPSAQKDYQKALIHYLLAQKLPVESQAIVLLCYIAATMAVVYASFHWTLPFLQNALGLQVKELCIPRTAALLYGGWAMYTQYIGKYYLNPFGWGEGL